LPCHESDYRNRAYLAVGVAQTWAKTETFER
jgi:hypothetical protein